MITGLLYVARAQIYLSFFNVHLISVHIISRKKEILFFFKEKNRKLPFCPCHKLLSAVSSSLYDDVTIF